MITVQVRVKSFLTHSITLYPFPPSPCNRNIDKIKKLQLYYFYKHTNCDELITFKWTSFDFEFLEEIFDDFFLKLTVSVFFDDRLNFELIKFNIHSRNFKSFNDFLMLQ